MGRESDQEPREEQEADAPQSEDADTERGGWPETESSPHEGEEGQDVV